MINNRNDKRPEQEMYHMICRWEDEGGSVVREVEYEK